MNNNERQFAKFVRGIKFDDTPDSDHRDQLEQELVAALTEQPKQEVALLQTWRTIMKSRIAKVGTAAAAIIIGGLIGIHHLGGSIDGASVAWAGALKKIQNAKTLTWKTSFMLEGEELWVMRAMVLEPHYRRFELPDGRIWILDYRRGKAVILDPSNNTFTIQSTITEENQDIYNTFRGFQNTRGYSAKRIGERQINEKKTIGFHLSKEDQNADDIHIWVDPQTQLPIQIEGTFETAPGRVFQLVTTEIVFDSELDQSLFSLEPPAGYERQQQEPAPLLQRNPELANRAKPAARAKHVAVVNRLKSAANLDRILKACRKYVEEHNGQWPDSLEGLTRYGLDKQVFLNPSWPMREVGYIYLKPPAQSKDRRIVLYEAYGVWESGINVGFTDYRVQFINDESDFQKLLGHK